jgi:nicotinate phosphoribosyltransferase
MKISNSFEKTTNPGIKQLYRFYDAEGGAIADLVTCFDEEISVGNDYVFYHPFAETEFFEMKKERYVRIEPLLNHVMKDGKRLGGKPCLKTLQERGIRSLDTIHKTYLRQINPHIYKVSLSEKLKALKIEILVSHRRKAAKIT